KGVLSLEPQGAFNALPDVREAIASTPGVEDDIGLCEKFLDEGQVAVVPGSAFGLPGYLRLSYATSDENLEKAMDRMTAVLLGQAPKPKKN
ncbi:MAG: aminotransferase class I/II-fold pyridoxal phosphate-dependent enzyme, partial [Gammaproteobacteria bacterium]|nr:aminotransferase class I/II-fold pyridoxal phosphate-dependent enzyme [Gammaproteobacteria bacterium]